MNKNTLTINGIEISLTSKQSAAIAAMLLGAKAAKTTEKVGGITRMKKAAKAAEVAEATPAEVVKDEAAEAAPEPFTAFKVALNDGRISFTAADGKFLYQRAPRQALNERLKAAALNAGYIAKYSRDVWAWEVTAKSGKTAPKTKLTEICKLLSQPIMPEELERVYKVWDANRAKKAAKAAAK